MKKQINPTIKAHLIRSAFYVLLLLAVCVIPFALAQRNTGSKNTASKKAAGKNVTIGPANRVAPATTTLGPNDPRRKGNAKVASSTRFSNAQGTLPRRAASGGAAAPSGTACWYDFTVGTDTFVPGVDDLAPNCDDCDVTVNFPFSVNLFGGSFTTAQAGSNGHLTFGAANATFTITCPPPFGVSGTTEVLAPYWVDQTVLKANSDSIFTTTTGSAPNRIFYVEWVSQYLSGGNLDYEVAIFENGTPPFEYIYNTINPATGTNDSQLVIGSKFDETCFTEFACDTSGGGSPPVSSGEALIASQTVTPTPTPPPQCSPWATASPYPLDIVRYGFVQTATDFYVFGGVSDGTEVNNVNSYNIATGMWTSHSPMPFTSEAPTCSLDASSGLVYCAQGDTGNGFASYNIATDTWTPLTADPFATDHYGSASGAFNGKVFVAGGDTQGALVDVYDVASDTWSAGTAAPAAFFLAGYQQVGNFLYVVGGFGPGSPTTNNSTTWRLDMTTAPGTWDNGPTFTSQRADFGLAFDPAQNKLYAMGGDANGGGFFDSTNIVEELDVTAWPGGTWNSSTPDLPLPNRQANQAGFNGGGGIWSVGGIDGSTFTFLPDVLFRPSCAGGGAQCILGPWSFISNYPGGTLESPALGSDGTLMYCAGGFLNQTGPTDATYSYDPSSDTWTPLASMVGPRYAIHGVYAPNVNKFYVFGGIDENFVAQPTTQIYDVASNTWSTGTDYPNPDGFYFPGVVYDDASGKIYVIGGFDGVTFTEQTNNWIYDPTTDTWDTATAAPIPVAVGGAGTTTDSGVIYVMGTWNGGTGSTMNQIYTIGAPGSWTTGADIPAPYYDPGTADLTGLIYLMGGGNPDVAGGDSTSALRGPKGIKGLQRRRPNTSYTDVRYYNPATDSWATTPSLNQARSFTAGTNVGNNRAIVVGGFDGVSGDTNTAETAVCGAVTPTPTPTATPTPTPTPTVSPTCPPVITESADQSIVTGNSVACNNGVAVTENHYFRAFNMNTFTGGLAYNVTQVQFGIEQATSGSGTGQPVTVNLYANHGSPFPGGDWQSNLIATSGSINIPDQALTIFTQPISVTVAAGTLELVMEVMNPDGRPDNNLFFIGSNPDGQSADSYLEATDCGVNVPTPTEDIGFPNMMIVFNVDGNCGGTPTPTPTATPTPTPTATATATPRPTPTARPRPTPYPRPTPP